MTKIVVTGAAGFIGSNVIKGLNARGITDIIAVDDLTQGDKFLNLSRVAISHYVDASVFYDALATNQYGKIEAIFHEGACSDTMEQNGKYMLDNNYTVSYKLYKACQDQKIRLLYASSAATYGNSLEFREEPQFERPLNVYGYSKLLFDQRMRHLLGGNNYPLAGRTGNIPQLVGFRYFNVYGPHEQHKGRMASVAYHQFHQFKKDGFVKLFGPYGGYQAGQQERDFVFIDDVVAVNLWFFDNPSNSGIFNLGSGHAETFNDIAFSVINTLREEAGQSTLTLAELQTQSLIEYIDFPDALRGKYQCHTQADMTRLRSVGCNHHFNNVNIGVASYMRWLNQNS